MRKAVETNPNMSEAEARAILVRCLKVMYYRDARSLNRYVLCTFQVELNGEM
jgi:20S proteasome subunit beta 7